MTNMLTLYRIIDAWRNIFGDYADAAVVIAVVIVSSFSAAAACSSTS